MMPKKRNEIRKETSPRNGVLRFIFLFGLLAAGCVGYRDYRDAAADRYPNAILSARPAPTGKRARYTVNVTCTVAGATASALASERAEFEALALRTIDDMATFAAKDVSRSIERPDYQFVFDVRVETTGEPGFLSGLIWPFCRSRQYAVWLQVLDEKGQPFASYTASAGTFEVRHPVLLFFSPFYSPGRADEWARKSVFEALAVKLIADRKEFL